MAGSTGFQAALNANGDSSTVSFIPTSTSALSVNAEGIVSTTGILAANNYTISGTDQDVDGDTGNWSYSLTVNPDTIDQGPPLSDTIDVAGSSAFSATLTTSSGSVNAPTYTVTGPNPNLNVSTTSGEVTTTGELAAGPYTVSGTDTDSHGDSGSWTYTLTVTPDTITQTSPTSGATTSSASSSFAPGTISTANNSGPVSFVTTVPSSALDVTSGGAITTTGSLSPGSYTVSGTDSDASGDTGTWTYSLSVSAGSSPAPPPPSTLRQTSPTSGFTTPSASSNFASGPLTVAGATGAVTFVSTSASTQLKLSDDEISTTGALVAGKYTISGTDHDASGDIGTWTFTLTVSSGLSQTSSASGTTTVAASKSFRPGAITVANATGTVTFVTSAPSSALSVTSAGVVTTTGALKAGKYTVSGTDSDASKNSGTWTYTLSVSAIFAYVTFLANGGRGSMTVESAGSTHALRVDRFTRAGYTFNGWNTRANGRGRSYTNGAAYSFTSSVTLYAQWKRGKAATHAVTFNANGGAGFVSSERSNAPRALTLNTFTRAGYTFTEWNTSPRGGGAGYTDGATYSFGASVTLYAQWTAKKTSTHTVTFVANGGKGTMGLEKSSKEKALTPNAFTRSGYRFLQWETTPNGKGAIYTNGADYPFATSVTLYAQWKKVIVLPPVSATVTISPFDVKSSALTSSLNDQIAALAATAKSDRDTQIKLTGYGDKLSKVDELNEAKWAANFTLSEHRASAVESYLRQQLAALGLTNVTVSATGSGSAISSAGASTPTRYGLVVAALT